MTKTVLAQPSVRPLRLVLIAGEHSGDALGAKLMAALRETAGGNVAFSGVGGEHMAAEGLESLFPLADVAVMGPFAILRRLPRLVARVYQAVDAAIAAKPDGVVIIDSPEFTHPIAKRIRRRRPSIPIVNYVSPTVWAWRPGRAAKMRPYVDHLLALLPFEPAAHERLGGPPCTYVGHPLVERLPWLAALDPEPLRRRLDLDPRRPVLVVLPGSRATEVGRLMAPFGGALEEIAKRGGDPQVIIPTLASVRAQVEAGLASWPQRAHIVTGEEDKFAAFKLARAALAASGTVTLELGLVGVPMVVGYRVEPLAAGPLRLLIKVPTVVLANLVLGEIVVPELIQEACTPPRLADALFPLLMNDAAHGKQAAALARIPDLLAPPAATPSQAAAEIVLRHAGMPPMRA